MRNEVQNCIYILVMFLAHYVYCSRIPQREMEKMILVRDVCKSSPVRCRELGIFIKDFKKFIYNDQQSRDFDWYLHCEMMIEKTQRFEKFDIIKKEIVDGAEVPRTVFGIKCYDYIVGSLQGSTQHPEALFKRGVTLPTECPCNPFKIHEEYKHLLPRDFLESGKSPCNINPKVKPRPPKSERNSPDVEDGNLSSKESSSDHKHPTRRQNNTPIVEEGSSSNKVPSSAKKQPASENQGNSLNVQEGSSSHKLTSEAKTQHLGIQRNPPDIQNENLPSKIQSSVEPEPTKRAGNPPNRHNLHPASKISHVSKFQLPKNTPEVQDKYSTTIDSSGVKSQSKETRKLAKIQDKNSTSKDSREIVVERVEKFKRKSDGHVGHDSFIKRLWRKIKTWR